MMEKKQASFSSDSEILPPAYSEIPPSPTVTQASPSPDEVSEAADTVPDSLNAAHIFAQEYISLLPPRMFTPSLRAPTPQPRNPLRRGLRRVKSLGSLRHSAMVSARVSTCSVSSGDTLFGTAPSSPLHSTTFDHDDVELTSIEENIRSVPRSPLVSENVGLQICLDLLTTELAGVMVRQHPMESQARTSRLQILLMIEGYEAAQRNLWLKILGTSLRGKELEVFRSANELLENWIQALYCIFDHS
jgi:hypothetical protein